MPEQFVAVVPPPQPPVMACKSQLPAPAAPMSINTRCWQVPIVAAVIVICVPATDDFTIRRLDTLFPFMESVPDTVMLFASVVRFATEAFVLASSVKVPNVLAPTI